ncbi:MAG: hypothetical protein PHW76_01115 [Alphaproteobacteria bacterium]|nr:hypothetical protein [Alphaproteobacteria bacterium]
MRYIPTVHDDRLRGGLFVSVGLHTLAFVFLLIELPKMVPPLPDHHNPIPFDIVTIGEITNTKIGNGEAAQSAPPAPVPTPTPPAPAAEPAPPSPQPQAKPEPPQPKPEAKPSPPQPKVEDIIEGLKKSESKKPAAEEKKPQAQQDLLGSVLKDVAKMKPATSGSGDAKAETKGSAAPGGLPNGASSSVSGLGTGLSQLSITEEDALRRQIEQCWNPPVGARNAEQLIVEVVIDVNADRTVANADIVDKGRYASDPFFRAAADAAMRALRNPRCSPLELAPEKYEQWKRINFTFDPRDML